MKIQIFLPFVILSTCTAFSPISVPNEVLDQSSVFYFSNSIELKFSHAVFKHIPYYTCNKNYVHYHYYFPLIKVKPPAQIFFLMEHKSNFKQDFKILDLVVDSFRFQIVPLLIVLPCDPKNVDRTQMSNLKENSKLVGQGRIPIILLLESTIIYLCHNCFHKQGLQTRQYNRGIHSGQSYSGFVVNLMSALTIK